MFPYAGVNHGELAGECGAWRSHPSSTVLTPVVDVHAHVSLMVSDPACLTSPRNTIAPNFGFEIIFLVSPVGDVRSPRASLFGKDDFH